MFRNLGLVNVHEDLFSTDKLQEPELKLRGIGTWNILDCFLGCLEELVSREGSRWSKERIDNLKQDAMKEVDNGVYHALD